MTNGKWSRSLPALLLAALFFAYIVYPLGSMFVGSVTLPVRETHALRMGWDAAHQPLAAPLRLVVSEPETRQAIVGTLWLALATVLGGGAWGLGLALLWHRREFPGRRFFAALGYAPLVLPPLVGTLAFFHLVGPVGVLWKSVGLAPPSPFSQVLIVHIYSFGLYTYAYVSAALGGTDVSREEAARSLGAGRFRTFFAAVWPAIRPSLFAAALVTFMAAAASFSAPYYFDTTGRYLTVEIYATQEREIRYALGTVLAGLSLAALPLFLSVSRADDIGAGAKGTQRSVLPPANAGGRWVRFALSLICAVILLAPVVMVAVSALGPAPATEHAGGAAFNRLGGQDWGALGRSAGMGVAAAAINILLAVGVALALRRSSAFAAVPVEAAVMLALALPGSSLAIALLGTFNGPHMLAFGLPLGGTAALLVLAYVIRTLPLIVRPVRAALGGMGADLERAGAGLGAGRGRVLWRVTLPALYPSLLAGGLICFVTAAGEFVASAILAGPQGAPVSVRIDQLHNSDARAAYALALCLMVVAGAAVLTAQRIERRK